MKARLAASRLVGAGVVALVAVALTGCVAQTASTRPDLPARPQVVDIAMRDHAYVFEGGRVLNSGRTVFRVANEGQDHHDLVMVKLPDHVDGVDEWLDTDVRGFLPVYRMKERGPGQRGVYSVDLEPGRYGLLCFVEDGEAEAHYKQGMTTDFRVHGAQ